MSDELVDPASAAEAKAIQFMQIAVMAAEGIAVLAAARAEARAARAEAGAEQLLSSIESTRGTAERLWQPALDPVHCSMLDEQQALTAWSAAQPWRDVEPAASMASRASLERLRELQPRAIDAYDALRADGRAPAEAMRTVVPLLAGTTSASTASAAGESVLHSPADAIAASYPVPLASATKQAPRHSEAASAALARRLPATTKPSAARLGG